MNWRNDPQTVAERFAVKVLDWFDFFMIVAWFCYAIWMVLSALPHFVAEQNTTWVAISILSIVGAVLECSRKAIGG